MPEQRQLSYRRGFTLLELLVVVSILLIAVLVFATFAGRALVGPSIERHAATIKGMTTGLRQAASTRQVHVEMVFDYRRDQVISLSRRRLVTFSFDTGPGGSAFNVGSGNVIANASQGAAPRGDRALLLRDGDALELEHAAARFTIPWMPQFETGGDYEGIAMTFDFYPFDSLPPGQTLPLVRMGAAVTLNVVEARANALRLGLTSSGVSIETDTWIALNRWATVELAVSAYGVTLYVDGRLSAAKLPPDFRPASVRDANIEIGGVPCRIDNFDVMGLVAGQVLELEGTHLVAPGVDPMLEVTMQAEAIYDLEPASGPVTGPDAAPSGPVAGLPRVPPPGLVHVYFDGSGKLDPARHPGAVEVHMVSGEPDEMKRVKLTFHPLGMITSDVVERFDWERDPVGTSGMNGNSK